LAELRVVFLSLLSAMATLASSFTSNKVFVGDNYCYSETTLLFSSFAKSFLTNLLAKV
jgi:hypothetical protein